LPPFCGSFPAAQVKPSAAPNALAAEITGAAPVFATK